MRFHIGTVLLALLGVCLVSGKKVSGTGYMSANKVNQLTKFSFSTGDGWVYGNITYYKEPKGRLYFFMDTAWAEYSEGYESCDNMKHAHTSMEVGRIGEQINKGLGKATGFEPVVEKEGRTDYWVWQFKWQISHHVRTYGWYFVAAYCDATEDEIKSAKKGSQRNYHRRHFKNRFKYSLELYNPNESHLPADELWMDKLYFLVLIVLIGFAFVLNKSFRSNKIHLAIKLLISAYILEILSIILEIIHLTFYSYNGTGSFFFDFSSELSEGISQSLISFVLLCLANGWTIVKSKKPMGQFEDPSFVATLNNPSLMDIDSPAFLLMIITLFMTTILQVVNKLFDDDFQKFHDYETSAGLGLLFVRTVYGGFFVFSLRKTTGKMTSRGERGSGFMNQLLFAGTLWFVSFPLLYIIASFFAHYLRHFVVSGGVLLVQSLCLMSLSYQFVSTKSTYAKYSEVSTSDTLPGFAPDRNKFF